MDRFTRMDGTRRTRPRGAFNMIVWGWCIDPVNANPRGHPSRLNGIILCDRMVVAVRPNWRSN